MILYNVTSNIDESIHVEWLTWMKQIHIPQVLATGKFEKATLIKVLVEEDMGGTTYAVQYKASSKDVLNAYFKEDAPKLRNEVQKKFADKVVSFRTELEIIGDYFVTTN